MRDRDRDRDTDTDTDTERVILMFYTVFNMYNETQP